MRCFFCVFDHFPNILYCSRSGPWFVKPPALEKDQAYSSHDRCRLKEAEAWASFQTHCGQAEVEGRVESGGHVVSSFGFRNLPGRAGDIKLLWALADEARGPEDPQRL